MSVRKFPKCYGGTVDTETGELYDERKPPGFGERQRPSVTKKAETRSKGRAARKARKRNRT